MSSEPPRSSLPPTMGPGARPMYNPPDRESMVQQIQGMRKYYKVKVTEDNLSVGYRLNARHRSYDIPFAQAQLSGFQRWLLYGGGQRSQVSGTFLLDMMRGAENMLGRPLSQQEAEAFAFHSGKRMTYGFLGMAVAVVTGCGLAARGWKTMKFPFRKAKPLENYAVFPARRLPLMSGEWARAFWQGTRFNAYTILSIIFLSPIFRSMGETVMAVGLYQDARTKDTVKAIKGGFDRVRMNKRQAGPLSSKPQGQQQQQQEQDSTDTSSLNFDNGDIASNQSSYGGFADSNDTNTSPSSRFDQPQRYGQNSEESMNASTERDSGYPSRPSSFGGLDEPSEADDEDRYDTASPVRRGGSWAQIRGAARRSPAPSQRQGNSDPYPSAQTESMNPYPQTPREENSGGGWRRPSGNSTDFETKGDSFSFSSSDGQRALAKEQAQREFDAMLDRERRESGSDDYYRGSQAAETGAENSGAGNTTGESAWSRRRKG